VKEKSIKILGFIIIALALIFGSLTWFVQGALETDYSKDLQENQTNYTQTIDLIDSNEWLLLSNTLLAYIEKAQSEGVFMVEEVAYRSETVFNGNSPHLANAIDTYSQPNNPFRIIISEVFKDSYFNNIRANNMDPFFLKGYFVEEDNSDDCASFGSSRSVEDEFKMHANPYLARYLFYTILSADLENVGKAPIENVLFMQFDTHSEGVDLQTPYANEYGIVIPEDQVNKKALVLESYDLEGLKTYFLATKSYEKTFEAFEFVVPSYIYSNEDISGRLYIEGGKRTSVDKLIINVVFNFKSVINNNSTLRKDLDLFKQARLTAKTKYDTVHDLLHRRYTSNERLTYFIIILLSIVCFMSLYFTQKLTKEFSSEGDTNL